jgi:tetratricopeptide (TPR) repeat protein
MTDSNGGGTSTCILDVWDQSARDDDICANAIGTLIVSRTELLREFDSLAAVEVCLLEKIQVMPDSVEALPWLLALSQIMVKTGRAEAGEMFRNQAIEVIAKSGWNAEQISEHAEQLREMIQSAGSEAAANSVRRRLRTRALMGDEDEGAYFELRELAFEAYGDGAFGDAEEIYRHLLSKEYEKPATLCHLARVLVGLGRDVEAMEAVERAYSLRGEAEGYVIARIYYLRALLATLGGREAEGYVSELQAALQSEENRTEWFLGPMLEVVRGRMEGAAHARFVELGELFEDGEE